MIRLFTTISLLLIFPGSAQETEERLAKFLSKHPAADSNQDGVLTAEEAKQYRMDSQRVTAQPAPKTTRRYRPVQLMEWYEARNFNGLPYRFLAPQTEPNKRYPLILSLHGAGGKGDDNVKNLTSWNGTFAEPAFQKNYPCFVVIPQSDQPWRLPSEAPAVSMEKLVSLSKTWQQVSKQRPGLVEPAPEAKLGLVFELLDQLAENHPIDPDRVYVLGHSMGGAGSFECVAVQPERFAAAIPSAGALAPWHDVEQMRSVPIWAFHGDQDRAVPHALSQEAFDNLKAIGGNMKLTTLGGIGHGAAEYAFAYTGDDQNPTFITALTGPQCDPTADVWDWLFAQKRGNTHRFED